MACVVANTISSGSFRRRVRRRMDGRQLAALGGSRREAMALVGRAD